jgi:hypothetical protein
MQTMDAQLNVRLPGYVMEALEAAASRRSLKPSALVRQAVLAHLIAEGSVTREQVGAYEGEWLRARGLS